MRRLSLTQRCALGSLAVVLLLGLVLAGAVDRIVRHEADAQAGRSGELVASFLSRALAPSALDRLALTPDEHAALDRVVADAADLRRLRVWGRDGRVLYDSQELSAPVEPVGPQLAEAYAGRTATQVRGGDLLEVHVPFGEPGQGVGVVEVSLDHAETAARSDRAVALLAALLVIGLAVVWALLWQLSLVVTRVLRRVAHEQEELARRDALTGLLNRRGLLSAVDGVRAAGTPCALVLLDLDRFQAVNSTLGHAVGDRLLVEVGARLSSALREDDVLGRFGGDEFGVLLAGTADVVGARAVADRLLAVLDDAVPLGDLQLSVQASAGVALAPQHAGSAQQLLQRADVALSAAKQRRTTVVYDPELDTGSDRLLLLSELEEGLAKGELTLAYQPCWDLQATGRMLAVEALVRWTSPRRGFVSPAEFVPLCEQTRLVRDLTAFVLGEALRQLRAWEDEGVVVNVAVNLSASNLAEEDLPELVAGLLARHRITADRLVLEITESAVIPDPARAARVLGRLVELGVDIAIDDFGTGFSSMSRLLELPLSALKVDRSFVADLPHGRGTAVVASATELAHELGLFVVAEGIETAEQLAHAVRLGCDVGQGYLLAPPLPPAAVPDAARRVLPVPPRLTAAV